MKRSFKMLAAAMFAAAALITGTGLQAQDAPPAGGFKNAFLNMGKSGKVSLTYTLWGDQVGKGNYTLAFFWASFSALAASFSALAASFASMAACFSAASCASISAFWRSASAVAATRIS